MTNTQAGSAESVRLSMIPSVSRVGGKDKVSFAEVEDLFEDDD